MERATKRLSMVGLILTLAGCIPDQSSTTGTGWTATRVDSGLVGNPVASKTVDLDGDGDLDVVSLWRGVAPSSGAREGALLLHVTEPGPAWNTVILENSARYAEANRLTVGDLNRDGRLDIVVAVEDRIIYLPAPADIRIGADWKPYEIAASIKTEYKDWADVAIADLDGIGGLDIVAALRDDGRLVWFQPPGNPDAAAGWTAIAIDTTSRNNANTIAMADLNGDGRLDVISSAPGQSSGQLSWYAHPGDPLQAWTRRTISSLSGVTRFALGDVNADGWVDIVAISPDTGRLAYLVNPQSSTATWEGWVVADYGSQASPFDIQIADVNADGQLDAVVAFDGDSGLWWYRPRTDQRLAWSPLQVATGTNGQAALFATGDFNADGFPDLIVPFDSDDNTLDRVDWLANPAAW